MAIYLRKFVCTRYFGNVMFRPMSSIKSKPVQVKKIGPLTCISINRPQKKNSLTYEVVELLHEAVTSLEADPSSNAAILYGEMGNFCYGYDVEDMTNDPEMITQIESLGLLDRYSKKPIVAAISGHAVGAGFDLALWCDFRIVEDTAVLGCYARKFGNPLSERCSERLQSILGQHKAFDLILTGRVVKAKEAFECGIASRIVACGTSIGQAVSVASSLANMPQACLRADRAALNQLSGKYSVERRKEIYEEYKNMYEIALKESSLGKHITKSGDVRQTGYKT